jgi:type I restriction enzyme S subunit
MKSIAETPLKEFALGFFDGPHATPPESAQGHIFLRIENITPNGRLDLTDIRFIAEEDFPRWTRRVTPQPGDVVFSYEATLHRYVLIPDGFDGCLGRRLALVRPNPQKIEPAFLLYYFLSSSWQRVAVSAILSGATVDRLSLKLVPNLPVRIPPLSTQRRIAEVLSPYDDLIENNRRRMALLEEAARYLYREWFVRLRFPGHERTPCHNGLPEGWMSKPIGDVAEFRLGKMLDQAKNKGDLMPYLANVNVRWGEFDLSNLREMRFEDNERDAFGLKYGDIVMCEGGEPGRCAIWKDQLPAMMIQKALHRIRARQNVSHLYLYHSLRHKGQSGQFAMFFTGATIKHLPREKLAKVRVEIPPARLMDLFLEQVGPIEDQINVLQAANRRASQARDLLLPRLMAGEIAV